jgi:Putative beta-barrel porin-2, OmpL-like. bbp2
MPNNDLEYYSVIFQQQFGQWHYVLQHDRGTLNHAINNAQTTAAWYSLVHYLTYQLDDEWALGVRGEWFKDQSGFRYGYGESGLYDVTVGVNWKPKAWLLVRPELRYDWADGAVAPFDSGRQFNQVLLGVDAVIQF